MIDPFNPGLQYYVDKMSAGDCYTWIRLGDGEWSAIMGDRRITSSRSQTLNHQSLRNGMRKVIERAPSDPRYILALRRTSYRANITAWLDEHTPDHVRFHDSTVLYKASKKAQLYPWVEALRNIPFPKIVIGPERHKGLDDKMFHIWRHVIIPNKNCWAMRQRILAQALRDRLSVPSVYLLSAGPAAKVFCWSLFQRVGHHSWILDCGSLFDPYVGKFSRQYMKLFKREPWRMKANLTGATDGQ